MIKWKRTFMTSILTPTIALTMIAAAARSSAIESAMTKKTTTKAKSKPEPAGAKHPGLLNPRLARETAPPVFSVRFSTTRGEFVLKATRAWAPNGVDRLYALARVGFFDNAMFFRVISGFMAQFGIHGDPRVSAPGGSAHP